jgi:hypothetical protein
MHAKQILFLAASLVAGSACGQVIAQETRVPYVQVAEIEIDPTQFEQYKAAVHEQIETAIRVEPVVLVLYAVADKDSPATSGFSKFTPTRTRTRRICNPRTSRNTRPRQRKWSGR